MFMVGVSKSCMDLVWYYVRISPKPVLSFPSNLNSVHTGVLLNEPRKYLPTLKRTKLDIFMLYHFRLVKGAVKIQVPKPKKPMTMKRSSHTPPRLMFLSSMLLHLVREQSSLFQFELQVKFDSSRLPG